jgi:hypothetical protein
MDGTSWNWFNWVRGKSLLLPPPTSTMKKNGKKCVVMKLWNWRFGFFAIVTKILGFCEIRSCLENYNLREIFVSIQLLCKPFVASWISFPSMIITMKENCPIMQQLKILLNAMHDFFKAVTYHSVTLFLSIRYFLYSPPLPPPPHVPLTSAQTIFSSVAKFIVPDWGT